MKLAIVFTQRFRKNFKKINSSEQELVLEVLERLAAGEKLEPRYKDHALQGKWKNCRDCHVKPDLVLIYKKNAKFLELLAMDISNHASGFKK